MSALKGLFKKPDPRAQLRASQREVNGNVRDIEREIQSLKREEAKCVKVGRHAAGGGGGVQGEWESRHLPDPNQGPGACMQGCEHGARDCHGACRVLSPETQACRHRGVQAEFRTAAMCGPPRASPLHKQAAPASPRAAQRPLPTPPLPAGHQSRGQSRQHGQCQGPGPAAGAPAWADDSAAAQRCQPPRRQLLHGGAWAGELAACLGREWKGKLALRGGGDNRRLPHSTGCGRRAPRRLALHSRFRACFLAGIPCAAHRKNRSTTPRMHRRR